MMHSVVARGHEDENRWAVGVTLNIPKRHALRVATTAADPSLIRELLALRDAGRIEMVLPFRHRPMKAIRTGHPKSWTDHWLFVLGTQVDPDELWISIAKTVRAMAIAVGRELLRAEVLRPQPGLQMYFAPPAHPGSEPRLWHWIEYVVSRPETREAYYREQYEFSAGVIRRFYEAGVVGRCIGFERERYLENNDGLPEWDVIHFTGVQRFAGIAPVLWTHRRLFNDLARRVGHESAFDVLRSWGAQRVKYQAHAVQHSSLAVPAGPRSGLVSRRGGLEEESAAAGFRPIERTS
jgi:hypothetical protein